MTAIEKRLAALEISQGKQPPSSAEIDAALDALFAKMGTTHAEQVVHYGSERALLRAVRESVEADISSRVVSKGGKP